MNKKGSITVEALISVSIMILVLTSLFQLLTLYPTEDIQVQKTYDALNQLDTAYYLYHKVGVFDFDFKSGNDSLDQLISSTRDYLNQASVEKMLEGYLKHLLNDTAIEVKNFALENDIITGEIVYESHISLGPSWLMTTSFEKRLWLFGNEKEIYPNTTLLDQVKDSQEKDKSLIVYVTKTGEKYHQEGCFYLIRSTTDKSQIKALTLYEAKKKHLVPCKRCMGGE